MTRRIPKVLLGIGTLIVVVAALAAPVAGKTRSNTARDGRWVAVGAGSAAGGRPTHGRPAAGMVVMAQVMIHAAKPVLLPRSTAYNTTGSNAVALTFDDGPDPDWTPQVLRLLRAYHIKATFCMIGVNVKAYPNLVRQIAADGHALCNHTTTHDEHLRTRSRAAIVSDLRRTSALITRASGGVAPLYFRAPGGNWSPEIVSVARSLNMTSINWSVDPRDWTKPPTGTIVTRVRSACHPGAIVLMHDGGGDRSRSVEALRQLLPGMTSRYRLIRL